MSFGKGISSFKYKNNPLWRTLKNEFKIENYLQNNHKDFNKFDKETLSKSGQLSTIIIGLDQSHTHLLQVDLVINRIKENTNYKMEDFSLHALTTFIEYNYIFYICYQGYISVENKRNTLRFIKNYFKDKGLSLKTYMFINSYFGKDYPQRE